MVAYVCLLVTGRDKAVWESILPGLCLFTVFLFVVWSPSPADHMLERYFQLILMGSLYCHYPSPPANPVNLSSPPFCLLK